MTAPRTVNLYVGEGRIIMLPKFKFGFNWRAGDPFIEFCNDTILRVLENLIMNQVLICHTEIKPVSFLYFFKRTTVTDYFSTNSSVNINLGSIEEKVLKIVSKRRSISAKKMIDYLISDILETPERIANPWREIFRKVIEKTFLKHGHLITAKICSARR